MPQVAAHYVIADRVSARAGAANPGFVGAHPAAYKLGAIGPDMSFFMLDGAPMRAVLKEVIDIYLVIAEVSELFQEITTKAGGPAADLADWITGGLSTDVGALAGRAMDALKKAAAINLLPGTAQDIANPFAGTPNAPPELAGPATIRVEASHISALFRQFGHPYSFDPPVKPPPGEALPKPGDHSGWWWMDVFHYRRTGLFAKALRDLAADDFERAYARGWMSHVAGDVCGHPYINGVVGGPYRNHVIRHLVVERMVDTWVHDRFAGGDIVNAKLHEPCDVGDDFARVVGLLNRAIDAVYLNPRGMVPIRPTLLSSGAPPPGEWQRGYDLMRQHLQLSTATGFAAPVPPPGSPAEFFEEIANSIGNSAAQIPAQFSGKKKKWWEILLAPFLAAAYALVTLFKLLTLPAGVLTRLLTLAPRWLVYFLQVALYDYVREARWMLALGGLGVPGRDDLARPLAQLWLRIPPHRAGAMAFNYPHDIAPRVDGFWLFDPAELKTRIEPAFAGPQVVTGAGRLNAECSPYPSTALPDAFIEGRPFDAAQAAKLEEMAQALSVPGRTIQLETETFGGTQFGSAVEFAERLMDPAGTMLGSFDLDGDMGYGFLSWEHGPIANPDPDPRYVARDDAQDILTAR